MLRDDSNGSATWRYGPKVPPHEGSCKENQPSLIACPLVNLRWIVEQVSIRVPTCLVFIFDVSDEYVKYDVDLVLYICGVVTDGLLCLSRVPGPVELPV